MTRWGVVATILAPTLDVLRFAAYHLDAGAHRLFIYLDDPESDAYALLKAHPKIRVHQCNDAHWKNWAESAQSNIRFVKVKTRPTPITAKLMSIG
jgi:hypothetical protein